MKLQFQPHWLMSRVVKRWGRRVFWSVLCCLSIVIVPSLGHSLTVQDVPNPQELHGTWVSDMANILSEDTERQLNQMISALEAENGAEIAVVTVANTNSQPTPKAFATRLLNYWGVGKAELDNGVLFLNSVGDRRVEIDTGYGIEEILPDAKVGAILDQEILPKFRNNDFDAGTLAGVEAIITALSGDVFASPAGVIGGARSGMSVRELVYSPLSLYVISVITLCATPVCIYKRTCRILDHPPKFLPMGRSRVLDPKCHGLSKTVVTLLHILSFFLCLAVFTLTLLFDPSARLWVAAIGVLGMFVIGGWAVSPRLQSYYLSRGFKPNDSRNGQVFLKVLGIVILCLSLFLSSLLGSALFFTGHSQLGGGLLSLIASFCGALIIGAQLKDWIHKKLTPLCANCQRPMMQVNETKLKPHLSRSQSIAANLKSTRFKGWTCPCCTPEPSRFHLRSYLLDENYFEECPNCEEFTMTYNYQILREPTRNREGTVRKTAACHACDYTKSEDKPLRTGSSSAAAAGFSGGGGGSCGGFGGGGGGGGGCGGGY